MGSQQLSIYLLIPLAQASPKYNVPFSTLRSWHRRGYLNPVGRLPANVPGGGVLAFLRSDIERLIADPPARGRRPKGERGGR